MLLNYTKDQIDRINSKLIKTNNAWLAKNGRVYLSDGICCQISSLLENNDTVTAYIEGNSLVSKTKETEGEAWNAIKLILKQPA